MSLGQEPEVALYHDSAQAKGLVRLGSPWSLGPRSPGVIEMQGYHVCLV